MSKDDHDNENLKSVLDNLTEREAEVLKKRFGIDVSDTRSLEDIARDFDITREKIEEIEFDALLKLRSMNSDPDKS